MKKAQIFRELGLKAKMNGANCGGVCPGGGAYSPIDVQDFCLPPGVTGIMDGQTWVQA